jgi:hypothetical protein
LLVFTNRKSPALAAGAHVVLRHAERLHHVEHPDDVGLVLALGLLRGERPVVLAVAKALRVEALHLAAAGHVPEAIPLHERRAADALERPVVDAAGGELLARILPEKRAVLGIEGEQAAEIDRRRIPLEPALAVVRADIRLAAGHDGIAVALAAERRDPGDVFARVGLPLARVEVEVAGNPLGRDVRGGRDVVAHRRAAPLAPVAGMGGGGDADEERQRQHPHPACGQPLPEGEATVTIPPLPLGEGRGEGAACPGRSRLDVHCTASTVTLSM